MKIKPEKRIRSKIKPHETGWSKTWHVCKVHTDILSRIKIPSRNEPFHSGHKQRRDVTKPQTWWWSINPRRHSTWLSSGSFTGTHSFTPYTHSSGVWSSDTMPWRSQMVHNPPAGIYSEKLAVIKEIKEINITPCRGGDQKATEHHWEQLNWSTIILHSNGWGFSANVANWLS